MGTIRKTMRTTNMDIATHDSLLADLRQMDPNAVLDGPVVSERYSKTPFRILWALREPNGDGPWDLREFLATDECLFTYPKWQATIGLLAKVSHGLVHGCPRARARASKPCIIMKVPINEVLHWLSDKHRNLM